MVSPTQVRKQNGKALGVIYCFWACFSVCRRIYREHAARRVEGSPKHLLSFPCMCVKGRDSRIGRRKKMSLEGKTRHIPLCTGGSEEGHRPLRLVGKERGTGTCRTWNFMRTRGACRGGLSP